MAGAVLWPGVDLWQTKQLPLVCSGRWHPMQCRFLGQFHPAVCETGDVSWWHRSHPSLVWHVWHRWRSMDAAIPCPRRRQCWL